MNSRADEMAFFEFYRPFSSVSIFSRLSMNGLLMAVRQSVCNVGMVIFGGERQSFARGYELVDGCLNVGCDLGIVK